jgi:hypothetical protein
MRRQRSGSTPHDAAAIDRGPQRRPSFLLALGRQRPRLCRSARSARNRTANLLAQRAIRLFTPARTPTLQGKAIGSAASPQRPRHPRRGQIPIAPAAPSVPNTPRFRALALFGRRPPERVDDLCIPASENLHNMRPRKRRPEGKPPKMAPSLRRRRNPSHLLLKIGRATLHCGPPKR